MLRASLLAAVALFASSGLQAREMPVVDKIVYIGTDDQGDLGTIERMPLTEALIENGRAVRFDNSHAQVPLCGPARCTFFTGQTAQNHGCRGNEEPAGGWANFKNSGLITKAAQQQGIKVALIGVKIINDFGGNPTGLGIDHYEVLTSHAGDDRYLRAIFSVNGQVQNDGDVYVPDAITRRCKAFMQANRNVRYLLICNYPGPHAPGIAAPRHSSECQNVKAPRGPAFNQADVSKEPSFVRSRAIWDAAEVDRKDENFAQRCRTNRATDEAIKELSDADRDAVKIVHSDNGMGYFKRYAGKLTAIDPGSTSVPLIFIDVPRGGRTHHDVVSNLDVPATIIDMMAVPPPAQHPMDGKSLRPFFEGPVSDSEWRIGIGISGMEGAVGGEDEDITNLPTSSECFVTKKWWFCKMFGGPSDGQRVLYDRPADKTISNNIVAEADPDIVFMLQRQALAHIVCAGAECWVTPAEMRRPRGK